VCCIYLYNPLFAAWATLAQSLNLHSEDTLLIRGGTTSVGMAAATLARSPLFNCSRVISTTRSSNKFAALKANGVTDVLLDNHNEISDEISKLTGGKGATKCIELVGGPTLLDSCQCLSPNGVISMIGSVSGEWACRNFEPMVALAPAKHLTIFASESIEMSSAPLQWIVDATVSGKVKPSLDKVFKIEQTGEAHAYMESNSAAGKVVCRYPNETPDGQVLR